MIKNLSYIIIHHHTPIENRRYGPKNVIIVMIDYYGITDVCFGPPMGRGSPFCGGEGGPDSAGAYVADEV